MKSIRYLGAVFGTVALCGCASDMSAPGHYTVFSGASAPGTYAVYFGTDNAEIDNNAAKTIKQAADGFRTGYYTRATVIGHTDTVGSGSHNQSLSERRAIAARTELVRDGVPNEKILTGAAGETSPEVVTPDMTPDQDNRRVIISLQ